MDIDATIAGHGIARQSVLTDHPYDPPFTYTIGRHLRGDPELIVFGGHPQAAGALLNELAGSVAGRDLVAGAELPVEAFDGDPVRLVDARPEWACEYGLGAFDHAGAPPWEVPFLQVRIPDDRGRLPGVDGRAATCWCCPDLSRHDRPYALASIPPGCTTSPVSTRHQDPTRPTCACRSGAKDTAVGRVERLRAQRQGEDRVRLLQPPVLAAWTTAGAVLQLTGATDPAGPQIVGAEGRTSPSVHLTWRWDLAGMSEAKFTRAEETLGRVDALDGVAVTADPVWPAVAAPSRHSHRVRATVRRLVRDGLAVEADPFSRPRGCTRPPRARRATTPGTP